MSVSITFIIYGTESCSTPLSLELVMIMDMHTEHPAVGMLNSFQPIGMCIDQKGILGMLRHLNMCIEHLKNNIRHSKSSFPSDLMKSSSCLGESLSTIPTGVPLREPLTTNTSTECEIYTTLWNFIFARNCLKQILMH